MNRDDDDRAFQNWARWIDGQVADCPWEFAVSVSVAIIGLAILVVLR